MRVGIHLPHIGRKAGPESIRRAAIQAEELGFADVWTSEHIILPNGAPYPPSPSFYDPVLALTWAAAYTSGAGAAEAAPAAARQGIGDIAEPVARPLHPRRRCRLARSRVRGARC